MVTLGREGQQLLGVDVKLAVRRRLLALALQDLAPDFVLRDGV